MKITTLINLIFSAKETINDVESNLKGCSDPSYIVGGFLCIK